MNDGAGGAGEVEALRTQVEDLQIQLDAFQQGTYTFVARLAHELRSPLGAILMWTHVLRMGQETDRVAAVDAIEASARAQSQMIGELLDLTRAMAGRLRLDDRPADLGATVRAAVEGAAQTAAAAGISLRMTTTESTPLMVRGDATRLQQMVTILVNHAIGVTPTTRNVTVNVTGVEGAVRVEVSDDGPGMSEAEQAGALVAFQSPAEPERLRPGSLGLELPLVRLLAELQGGSVTVHSPGRGGGLTVVVTIPALEPEPPATT